MHTYTEGYRRPPDGIRLILVIVSSTLLSLSMPL